jgi:hypothetical protein
VNITQPLGPTLIAYPGSSELVEHRLAAGGEPIGQGVEPRVRVLRQDLGERGEAGGHRQRVAVEGAEVRHAGGPAGEGRALDPHAGRGRIRRRRALERLDGGHHLAAPAEGADRDAAADALGQAEQVGLHAVVLVGAARTPARRRSSPRRR